MRAHAKGNCLQNKFPAYMDDLLPAEFDADCRDAWRFKSSWHIQMPERRVPMTEPQQRLLFHTDAPLKVKAEETATSVANARQAYPYTDLAVNSFR
jgi:hypothetical protein